MGLYDRDYMHDRRQDHAPMSAKQMLWALIIINVAAYFLFNQELTKKLMLSIAPGDGQFHIRYIWEVFSASFLHFNFGHIFFNMWGLYIFGSLISPYLNGAKLLTLYLLGAAFGNILFILCNLSPARPISLAGASGAVCAFMAAAATLEPDRRFTMIFMPFTPVKTTTLVICYTALEMISGIFSRSSGIAHLAHLGGFVGGYIIMLCFFGRKLNWDPFRALYRKFTVKTTPRQTRRQDNFARPVEPEQTNSAPQGRVTQKELNYLLDKLSARGINSLSEQELARLRQARKQMRGEE